MRMIRGLNGIGILAAMLLLRPIQDRIDALTHVRSLEPDLMFFKFPESISKMALGYNSLLADVYWIRAVQYYGRREEAQRRPVRYGNLATLLDVTSTLDPDMINVYRFGSSFLSEPDPIGAGRPDEAIRLLDKGISRHSDNWRLRHDKALVYYWYLKQYKQAADIWLETSRIPGAPDWMPSLAASAMSSGGAVDLARRIWEHQLESSDRADVRDNARSHLVSIQVDEDLWTLEFLIEKFRSRNGRTPTGLGELVNAGWLRRVPEDPSGAAYSYDPVAGAVGLSRQSSVRRLRIPYDYRDAFLEKLEREFGEKP
jgi:hypothetical protein